MPALTIDQFRKVLPNKVKKSISQELVDQVNQTLSEPELFLAYRDNLLSYTNVMADGRFKIEDYVNAVRYVSHKLMGSTNIDAYIKTFPDRYQYHLANNTSDKDISSYVSSYNKNKLVNLIYEQTIIPTAVLNQDLYQEALNTQAELMRSAKSEKVRTDAANSLLVHLKMPETQKIELDIGMKEDDSIKQLRESTLALVRQQRMMIESGAMNAQEVANSKIIVDVEATEIIDA